MKVKKPAAKREKSTSTVGHYVKNSDLLPAVIEAKELGYVTDKLIRMIYQIADRYSRKFNFAQYSFREDMVASAVMHLCNNALNFNPEKSQNPFAFYTTAIYRSFLQYIMDEKKHRNIRDALLISAGSNPSFSYMGDGDDSGPAVRESDEVVEMESADVEVVTVDGIEVPAEVRPNEILPGDTAPRTPREDRVRFAGRAPSPVVRCDPNDFYIDPNTKQVVKKTPGVEPPVAIKKTRRKAVKEVK